MYLCSVPDFSRYPAFSSWEKSAISPYSDVLWNWDLVENQFWISEDFAKITGYADFRSTLRFEDWIENLHADDREHISMIFRAAADGSLDEWNKKCQLHSNCGEPVLLEIQGKVFKDSHGKPSRIMGVIVDVTARNLEKKIWGRTHSVVRLLNACNEALVRSKDEKEFLTKVCREAVETGGFLMAWVGLARHDSERAVDPMVWYGREEGYLSEMKFVWSDAPGKLCEDPCFRGGRFSICAVPAENSETSVLSPKEAAEKRGYKSVICLPLEEAGKISGFLTLYGQESLVLGFEETKFLESLAKDLAFGISNIKNRKRIELIQKVVFDVSQAVHYQQGPDFYEAILKSLVKSLGAYGCSIVRVDSENRRVHTLSCVLNGVVQVPTSYDIRGNPCEVVYEKGLHIFPHSLQQQFPNSEILKNHPIKAAAGINLLRQHGGVVGIMSVMFDHPIEDEAIVGSILRLFGGRIGAEMEREIADQRILEQASLLDKAQDAIFVSSLDHTITYWNQAAHRLYGWSAEEAIGKRVELLIDMDAKDYHQAHQSVIEDGEWAGEIHQRARNGREQIISGRWNLVEDDFGKAKSIFAINTDITEHRKLEQQLIRAQRMQSIGTMAGGLAHDLNNILAPVSMATELLRMRIDDERGVELLNAISSSAKRAVEMVDHVISFSRGNEGRRVKIDPQHLISEIQKIGQETFFKRRSCHVDVAQKLWSAMGDPTQLHQVLLNLCLNAQDATCDNGNIIIKVSNEMAIDESSTIAEADAKPYICISVEDDGIGISNDIIDKIFDPFFTTKARNKGTGLGLPTILAIVKNHGGFVRVDCAKSKGARFCVYLPAILPSRWTSLLESHSGFKRESGGRILIVDDEESIRLITQKTLEAYGYKTFVADGGKEALEIYSANIGQIEAVIVDMAMPQMNGIELIERLHAINPAVKVMAVSGLASYEKKALEAGVPVRAFLMKPYRSETLLNVLTNVINNVIG